jgi:hypothetical protein
VSRAARSTSGGKALAKTLVASGSPYNERLCRNRGRTSTKATPPARSLSLPSRKKNGIGTRRMIAVVLVQTASAVRTA